MKKSSLTEARAWTPEAQRCTIIRSGTIIVELKSVERVIAAHKKQLPTCLKLSGLKLGYLLNFGEALMKDGITRIINGDLWARISVSRASMPGIPCP